MHLQINASFKMTCALTSALVLSACGGGSSGGGGGGIGDGGFGFGGGDDECAVQNAGCYDERTSANDSHSIVQFDGRWLSSCKRLEDSDSKFSDDAAYRVETMLIGGQAGSRSNSYYTDSACATPATVVEVASNLSIYYASVFEDGTVGVDNIVLVNLQASDLTFDSVAANDVQEAEITRSRAERTFYTSMQLDTAGSTLYVGTPEGFASGRSSDDRILNPNRSAPLAFTRQ